MSEMPVPIKSWPFDAGAFGAFGKSLIGGGVGWTGRSVGIG